MSGDQTHSVGWLERLGAPSTLKAGIALDFGDQYDGN